jgi:hypothetical protein
MESQMTYREQFPDFDPATMPAIPAEWQDTSWHNDACPSFRIGNGKMVFIDHADPAQREFAVTRFSVQADPEVHNSNDVLLDTDDWSDVLEAVK